MALFVESEMSCEPRNPAIRTQKKEYLSPTYHLLDELNLGWTSGNQAHG